MCCGYDKYHGSLHFHHVDPSLKDPNWKNLKNKQLEVVLEEIVKCILVCANCHGEIHAGLLEVGPQLMCFNVQGPARQVTN